MSAKLNAALIKTWVDSKAVRRKQMQGQNKSKCSWHWPPFTTRQQPTWQGWNLEGSGLRFSITLIKMEDPSPCQSNQLVEITEVHCKCTTAATELNLWLSDISWVLSCITTMAGDSNKFALEHCIYIYCTIGPLNSLITQGCYQQQQ